MPCAQFGHSLCDFATERAARAYIACAAACSSETEYPQSLALIGDLLLQFSNILFCYISHISLLTCDDADREREFRACLAQSFARDAFYGAVNLEDYPARSHIENVACDIALAATHAHFRGFAGKGSVGENAGPNLRALAARARKCATRRFYLIGGDTRLRERLQSVRTERDGDAAGIGRADTARTATS